MFYYIDVHLLAHNIQWIKMHGETVKNSEILFMYLMWFSAQTAAADWSF
jgi:hypothetical protein